MTRAIKEGSIRFQLYQEAGYKAYGAYTRETSIRGRLAEIIFGEDYLGVEVPEDIDLAAALRRGDDVAGWQIRSSNWRNGSMMIKPKDKATDTFAQVLTHDAPKKVYITGWLAKAEAVEKLQLTSMKQYPERKIWDCPQEMLHAFPSIGGMFMRRHNALAA